MRTWAVISASMVMLLADRGAFAQGGAQTDCATAAFTDYNKANLALLEQGLLSVEATIAQRRLQEQFCLRFVKCALGNTGTDDLRFQTGFSSCLEDEALEKYDAVPRDK